MQAIDINPHIAQLLNNHGVATQTINDEILTDLPTPVAVYGRALVQEMNGGIKSRMDIVFRTPDGQEIMESFVDVGTKFQIALENNFTNFCSSSFYPLLRAFGSTDTDCLTRVDTHKWEPNGAAHGVSYNALYGPMAHKIVADQPQPGVVVPPEFHNLVLDTIRRQPLINALHWFRGYYAQLGDAITVSEFLMDNQPVDGHNTIFKSLPLVNGVKMCTCRMFVVLMRAEHDF